MRRHLRTAASLVALTALFVLPTRSPAQPSATPRVLLYPEPNYGGTPLVVVAGESLPSLSSVAGAAGSWNDKVSSVRIEGMAVVTAFESPNFRGAQTTITRNSADLATLSLGDRRGTTWDDRISSVRVAAVPNPHSVAIEWNRRDAERAVRSAYHDILGRDPDDAGLNDYRARLMDRGWTEDQLRDNLRNSQEFKSRDYSEVVRKTYREVLHRDPDESGVATYTRRLQNGMSEAELRAELKRSGEGGDSERRDKVTRAYKDLLQRAPDAEGLAHYMQMMKDRGWDETRVRDALRASDEYKRLPRR